MAETDTIKDMQLSLMEKRLAEDGLLETLHNIKTACILQVEEEWETTKDKALSNATKRNAEVELRLSGDEEYTMRQRQQDDVHREIQRDQIELDFQLRQFQRQNGNASISMVLERIAEALEGSKPEPKASITYDDGTVLEY